MEWNMNWIGYDGNWVLQYDNMSTFSSLKTCEFLCNTSIIINSTPTTLSRFGCDYFLSFKINRKLKRNSFDSANCI